jgi:hypothetical protein
MRALLVSLLLIVFMTSIASAELLTTANPIGQGGWAFLGAGIRDSNLGNQSTDFTLTTIGGYLGYGITDKLDAYLQIGSSTSSTYSETVFGYTYDADITGTGYGANLKYTVLEEGEGMPVSAAVGLGYKSVSSKMKTTVTPPNPPPPLPPAGEETVNGSQIMVGIGVSKIIVPFIPYGALAYRKDSADGEEASTQIDITVGSAIAWSTQGAVFVEYTNQSITPKGGDVYTSGQMALGVGYKI